MKHTNICFAIVSIAILAAGGARADEVFLPQSAPTGATILRTTLAGNASPAIGARPRPARLRIRNAPETSAQPGGLVALVHIADLLCRMSGLNYGYLEQRQVSLFEDSGFALLALNSAALRQFDWARLTFELDSYMDEVHSLVRAVYRK